MNIQDLNATMAYANHKPFLAANPFAFNPAPSCEFAPELNSFRNGTLNCDLAGRFDRAPLTSALYQGNLPRPSLNPAIPNYSQYTSWEQPAFAASQFLYNPAPSLGFIPNTLGFNANPWMQPTAAPQLSFNQATTAPQLSLNNPAPWGFIPSTLGFNTNPWIQSTAAPQLSFNPAAVPQADLTEAHATGLTKISVFSPAVDLSAQQSKYVVKVEIPGVNPENINLNIDDKGILYIEAKKEEAVKDPSLGYFWKESTAGKYVRQITLPGDINVKDIDAKTFNGILEITIPRISSQSQAVKVHG